MTRTKTFPKKTWETATPSDVGMDPDKLDEAKRWLDEKFEDDKYRVAVVRGGYLVGAWTHAIDPDEKIGIASANKSPYPAHSASPSGKEKSRAPMTWPSTTIPR